MNKFGIFLVAVMALSSVSFSTSALDYTYCALASLCQGLKNLLPVAAMLMIVIAGVIYAAGQVMGAETRARANVWATAALTGALIAVLIWAIAPTVLSTVYGTYTAPTVTCPSGITIPTGTTFTSVCG